MPNVLNQAGLDLRDQAGLDLRATMKIVRAGKFIPEALRSSFLEVLEYHYPASSKSRNGRVACSVCYLVEPGQYPCHTLLTLTECISNHPDLPASWAAAATAPTSRSAR